MELRIASFLKKHKVAPKVETARSYVFDCPICGGAKKLYIQKSNGNSVCFKGKSNKCPKPGSNAAYALSIVSGLPYNSVKREVFEFIEQLKDEIHVDFDDHKMQLNELPLPPVSLPLDVCLMNDPNAIDGFRYLEGRGIPKDLQYKYNLMFSPGMRRVIFPVIMNNIICGWQGRAIDKVDHNFRMYNIPGGWKSRSLMFYPNIMNKDFAILAEGPVSALKFAKIGNFVASMGKEISKSQMKLLQDSGIKKLYLALDRDAIDKIMRIRYILHSESKSMIECYIVNTPKHREDFGDCTFDECEAAFESAELITGDELFVYI